MATKTTKLKSRTGCLTCVARKKKCDEKMPRCGHCERLGLSCKSRSTQTPVTLTNIREKSVSPRAPISTGYPSFTSDEEKRITIASSQILAAFVSWVADPSFHNLPLIGRLCVQSRLVREAIMAFSVAFYPDPSDSHIKMSLRSYQSCIAGIQSLEVYGSRSSKESIALLTAVCFLGLLEGLNFGSSTSAVAHFDMCRKLIVSQLKQSASSMDAGMMNILRVFAECVLYNVASLTPFCVVLDSTLDGWGDAFDLLFPGDGISTSPFLGGLQVIYRVQIRIHMLLRSNKRMPNDYSADQSRKDEIRGCSEQLDKAERQLASLTPFRAGDDKAVTLYKAKHRVTILAARIHLHKVAYPGATSLDHRIQHHVSKALEILRVQEFREPGNPAMRWPFTILACVAISDEDFELVKKRMQELEKFLYGANSRKLRTAYTLIGRHRAGCAGALLGFQEQGVCIQPIDFLLMPQLLDEDEEAQASALRPLDPKVGHDAVLTTRQSI